MRAAIGPGREEDAGVKALSSADALQLFDTAMVIDEPLLLPAHIDTTALRANAAVVPPMFVASRSLAWDHEMDLTPWEAMSMLLVPQTY